MTDFLPADYKDNKSLNEQGSSYMKFNKGVNRFRIMSSPIVGWSWWNEKEDGSKVPVRIRINEKIDISKVQDEGSIKRFWAMLVYNYDLKKLQILEITQKGIQKTLESLVSDDDWGTPVQTYDIVVTKIGEGMETKYEVLPKPKTPLTEDILKEFKMINLHLENLYKNEDPFQPDHGLNMTPEEQKKQFETIH